MTWNIPLLEATIIPEDVSIIQSLAVSRFGRPDTNGWHFTKNGKYSVKSGYMVEQLFPNKGIEETQYGLTITSLQASVWKIKCPPKIQHFIWQTISGCVSVAANLRSRGINCDSQCGLCGAEEETINHVLFECPLAIQTWALSKIPSCSDIFPVASIFTNLDYLIYRQPKEAPHGYFPWIMWYLWKGRNDKLFKNIDKSPMDILLLAETEGKAWEVAQELEEIRTNIFAPGIESLRQDRWWCQVDGSWKKMDNFSGQGWVSTWKGTENQLFGARNIRCSQSPLHAEIEALIWAMECMFHSQRLDVVFATDCHDVVKMVSSPEEWPAFAVHLDEVNRCKSKLQDFTIIYRPRETITRADSLARSARSLSSETVYVGPSPPVW